MSNKTSDKNVGSIEDDVKVLKEFINLKANKPFRFVEISYPRLQEALEHLLTEREQKDKRIQELEEYISIAPNLDEMTATKFINIQRETYIRGKAEEQQRAEQIIYENYIPKQAVIDKIKEYDKKMEEDAGHPNWVVTDRIVMNVLQELLETK